MSYDLTRRKLLGAASTGLLAARVAQPASTGKPTILGGRPVRTTPFPSWPVVAENDERAWMQVLRHGKWNRLDGDCARRFEETWAATVNAVLIQHAIPVFVDTDPETFQIDARKIEAAITERTRCILLVQSRRIAGGP